MLEPKLPSALPAEPDSSGRCSGSHPGAGLLLPPLPPADEWAATYLQVGLACLERQLRREYIWQVTDEGYIISDK